MADIRVADDLLIDLLFAANGETYESIKLHIREIAVEGAPIKVLNIECLIKTKSDYSEKDLLDKQMLMKIKDGLA